MLVAISQLVNVILIASLLNQSGEASASPSSRETETMENTELLIALEHLLEDAIALGIKGSRYSGSAVQAERLISKYRNREQVSFIMKRNAAGQLYMARAS